MTNTWRDDEARKALDRIYAVEDSSLDDGLMLAQMECLLRDEWQAVERDADGEALDR